MGAKISYYRHLRGYTQVELSERIAISSGYLSKIERAVDVSGVPLSTYMKIAQALDVTIADLMKE